MVNEIEALFERQVRAWPRLARGVEGLKESQTRSLKIDWFEVLAMHIPHRVASTTAAVDAVSISKRPCFLCPGGLDPEEEGIPFGTDYTMYFNPFPIVNRHLSIVHRRHVAQRIDGEFGTMLDLAAVLPGYFVIYNGPQSGASAPDHMHFQAGSRAVFPIEGDTAALRGISIPDYARNVFVFRDSDRSRLIDRVNRAIELLARTTSVSPEPMINIAAFHRDRAWTVYLFPRAKHRPRVYETGELTISPGTIDLCGIVVVTFAKDFARISAKDVAAIFREVTLPDKMFEEIAQQL